MFIICLPEATHLIAGTTMNLEKVERPLLTAIPNSLTWLRFHGLKQLRNKQHYKNVPPTSTDTGKETKHGDFIAHATL